MATKRVYLVLSVAVVVALGTAFAQSPAPGPSSAAAGEASQTGLSYYTVESREVGAQATLGGSVVPFKEVTLTAELPGRVVFLRGEEGTRFNERQVLVALNEDDLLAQRRAAVADMANADFALRNSYMQYQRQIYSGKQSPDTGIGMGVPNLFDQFFTRPMGAMTGMGNPAVERRADVYGAVSQVEQAQAALHRARSRIDQIDSKLRDTRSVAPFAGVIVEKFVEVGDTVQPGQPLLRIADDRRLQIRVDVPARLIEGLRVGMVVQARLDVGHELVEARVARIYPMADPQRHTVTVKLDLQPGGGGRPGMYAEVIAPDISVPRSTLPWVPESAVQWRGSLPAVFVVTDEGRTELRMIRVGERWGSGYTVLSGLQVGERIVAAPPPGMVSGWGSKSEK